ncbi:hypothetical protein Y032_0178g630 [Ancylostoma ceylanicum]|uniref:Uncharacterized protein n=1 Tax=Ancylostoma ceylanicum TaxID=53326 RepID=A0A016STS4_9BILA|nr:hypothetical protein Y032_0178g630 [Ancylostoma ceylanicum]
MPRVKEERTWKLMGNVPPNQFFLTREALSLQQKLVAIRQTLIFLQRCKKTDVLPSFIMNKKIGATCGLSENDPKTLKIYCSMLSVVTKERQRSLYATLLKCNAKENACRRLLADQTWRRIDGWSRLICDSIRSKAKSTLLAKYNRLSSALREKHSRDESDQSTVNRLHPETAQNEHAKARVTVIGNAHLFSSAIELLSLGPSFSPAQNINGSTCRKVVGGLHRL